MPKPLASTGVPPVATPTAQPGVDAEYFANTASTFVSTTGALLPRSAAGSSATQIARPKPCTMLKVERTFTSLAGLNACTTSDCFM